MTGGLSMATRSGRSTTSYSKCTRGIIWAVLVNIAVISVHMEGLLSSSSLPSADFSITADSSGEEEDGVEGQVTIFTRTDCTILTGGDEEGTASDRQDVVVLDIEDDHEKDGRTSETVLPSPPTESAESWNEHMESGNERTKSRNESSKSGNEDHVKEWDEFQSQFYSVLEASESVVHEATLAGQLLRLRDDLQSTITTTTNNNTNATDNPTNNNVSSSVSVGTMTGGRDNKMKPGSDSGSSKLLQSSCFDHINETDLDVMLEAIKEEGEESREATPAREEGPLFEWEPLVATEKANEELMSQLKSASVLNEAEIEEYRSVFKNTPSVRENKKQNYSDGADHNEVIHLDLRPMNNSEHDSHDEMSQSAKRLMALRLSTNKSIQEEEESYDAHSWKIERRKYKSGSTENDDKAGTALDKTSSSPPVLNQASVSNDTPPSPSSFNKAPPSTSVAVTTRTRLASSDSISEDEVFSNPHQTTPTSREGPAEKESTQTLSQCVGGGAKAKQEGRSKRRKHKGGGRKDSGSGSESESKRQKGHGQKGRGRKDSSGSGSDGESKGKKKRSDDSRKDTSKQQKSRKSTSPSSSSSSSSSSPLRDRKDSWTQSSDDDTVLASKVFPSTLPPPGRSLSEGDGESVVRSLEKVKAFLRQKIELRKPPSLFNIPNTSPLFHQDVSFTDPLHSFHPSLCDTQSVLLLLPLTETGVIDMDTVDLPSHTLSISATHLLHTLLITWLVSLTAGRSDDKETSKGNEDEKEKGKGDVLWRPFIVNGLQQTIVDGLACLLVSVPSTDSNGITQLLSGSNLGQIVNPLINTLNLQSSSSVNEDTFFELHSLSSTPLSCLLTPQTDTSLISTPLSFYPHSFYSPRCLPSTDCLCSTAPLQNTLCTISQANLCNTSVVFGLLFEATRQGLDITGLRLVYDDTSNKHFPLAPLKEKEISKQKLTLEETLNKQEDSIKQEHISSTVGEQLHKFNSVELVLAVSFRGPNAIARVVDIVGPDDHALALITDPTSLSAQYGGGHCSSPDDSSNKDCTSSSPLVSCIRSSYWGGMELAKWFGGRACLKSGSIIGVSDAITKSERRKRQRVRFSESESEDVIIPLPEDIDYPPLISNRPALLVYPYSKVILVVSPVVTPLCYSTLFDAVSKAGFDLLGIKRIRLNSKRALSLNIPSSSISYFTPSSSPLSLSAVNDNRHSSSSSLSQFSFPPLPSMLLILARENASSHVQFLTDTVSSALKTILSQISDTLDPTVPSSSLLHATDFTEEALKVIGSYTFTPSSSSGAKPSPSLLEEKGHKEELSLIAIPGTHSLATVISTLDSLTSVNKPDTTARGDCSSTETGQGTRDDDDDGFGGFEFLGIKVVPSLSRFQAKQLCPHPQYSAGFSETVDNLFAKPVLLLLVRGINCSERVQKLLKGSDDYEVILGKKKSSGVICSSDFNKAFYLSTLFFIDKELFSDSRVWPWACLVPPAWINDCAILSSLSVDPEPLLSVFTITLSNMTLLVKVLEKLSRSGFRFVGMKLTESENTGHSEKFVIAVCVERYSAVWYLSHQLKLFTHSSNSYSKAIYFSPDFMTAVADVQFYFPCGGVHTLSSALLKYYQVSSDPAAATGPISPKSKVTTTTFHDSLAPPTSPLSEDAYLILPPSYLSPSPSPSPSSCGSLPFITVLDVLARANFTLTDILMMQLNGKMAKEIIFITDTSLKEEVLCENGPCILIGVRRDNAASCFHSIISNFLLHCSIREDTVSIGRTFDGLIVTGTAQQAVAVRAVLKTAHNLPEQ